MKITSAMGLLKKVVIIVIVLMAIAAVIVFIAPAYPPPSNLELFMDSSAQPSFGHLSSLAVGDEVVVFPSSWNLKFIVSLSNQIYSEYKIRDVTYTVYLGETKLSEGQLPDTFIPRYAHHFPLQDIQVILPMDEIAEGNPEIITDAVNNRGQTTFTISITFKTPALIRDQLKIGSSRVSRDLEASVHVVDAVSIYDLSWMSGDRSILGARQGEEIVGRIRLSQIGQPVGDLQAEITEITSDGGETVIAVEDMELDPTATYDTYNVSWRVPESLPTDCEGFSIRILYGGVEVWSAPTDPPPLPLVRSLTEALSENLVQATLRGTGYCAGDSIKLEVKAEIEANLVLEIEASTVLINTGSGQNMIVGETTTFKVEPKIEVELDVEAYCLDMHKDNPSPTEVFTIMSGASGYSDDAVKLMQSLPDISWEHKSVGGVQIALWVLIEDPTRSELEHIFAVTDSALEDAEWLLQNIGVDPAEKELFSTG
jgi:hypothetical protein